MQPWLAGIFAGTLFWVLLRWFTHVLPSKWHNQLNLPPLTVSSNIFYLPSYELCIWSVFFALRLLLRLYYDL